MDTVETGVSFSYKRLDRQRDSCYLAANRWYNKADNTLLWIGIKTKTSRAPIN